MSIFINPNTMITDHYFAVESHRTSLFTHGITLLTYLQYQEKIRNYPLKMMVEDLINFNSPNQFVNGFKTKLLKDSIRDLEKIGILKSKTEGNRKYLLNLSEEKYQALSLNSKDKIAKIFKWSIGIIADHHRHLSVNDQRDFLELLRTKKFWEMVIEGFHKEVSNIDIEEYKNLKNLHALKMGKNLTEIIKNSDFQVFIEFYDYFVRIFAILL